MIKCNYTAFRDNPRIFPKFLLPLMFGICIFVPLFKGQVDMPGGKIFVISLKIINPKPIGITSKITKMIRSENAFYR